MGPEAKLYKKLKAKSPKIIWTRIENLSLLGCPDLLGYNTSGNFFTVELKTTKVNKLKFSPHQISFHIAHPKNTFILAPALGPGSVKLFHGSRIKELVAWGLELEACALGLEACVSYLEQVGSKA